MCERSPLSQPGLSSRVSCTTWASVSLRACHGVPSQLECVFPFRARSSSVFALVCSSGAARNELLVPVANTIVLSKSYPLSRRGPIHTQSTPPLPPQKYTSGSLFHHILLAQKEVLSFAKHYQWKKKYTKN